MKSSILVLILLSIQIISCSKVRRRLKPDANIRCDCMEYWDCTLKDGVPEGYCDPSETKVCCFHPQNNKSISLLPLVSAKSIVCGRKGTDSGKDGVAELGEWPWHVAVIEKDSNTYVSGGSLLDEFWVLTAAHSVDLRRSNSTSLKVRLGEFDVQIESKGLPYQEFGVTQVVLHPQYDNTTLTNDIALLRLEKRARKRPHVNIVCLPRQNDDRDVFVNQKCVVTGWGRPNESSSHSIVLKEIPVPLWTTSDCQSALRSHFGNEFKLSQHLVCAGAKDKDSCDGDGGGPLVCENGGIWYQVGIVSFGVGCGRPNTPGVYTYVPPYNSWIKSTVLQNG